MTGRMEEHRIQVEKRLSRATYPDRDYRGRCDEKCLKYLTTHMDTVPELILVHGVLEIVGAAYEHAWIEIRPAIMFDAATQRFYDKAAWDRLLHPRAHRCYTPLEAVQRAATTGHAGPWHDIAEPELGTAEVLRP
jgi:hypothetical protein